jgi:hypothetical protein
MPRWSKGKIRLGNPFEQGSMSAFKDPIRGAIAKTGNYDQKLGGFSHLVGG